MPGGKLTLVSKATLSKNQKKQVRKIVRTENKKTTELKYHQDNGGTVNLDAATGRFDDLSNIAQGDHNNQRIGIAIHPTSLDMTIRVDATDATPDTYNTVRVILFRWTQDSTDFVPDKDDILLPVTGTVPQCWNPVRPASEQFNVLYDKMITVQGGNEKQVSVWRKRLGLAKNKPIDYKSDVATTGTDHLYLFAISDSDIAPHPNYEFCSLLRYND